METIYEASQKEGILKDIRNLPLLIYAFLKTFIKLKFAQMSLIAHQKVNMV